MTRWYHGGSLLVVVTCGILLSLSFQHIVSGSNIPLKDQKGLSNVTTPEAGDDVCIQDGVDCTNEKSEDAHDNGIIASAVTTSARDGDDGKGNGAICDISSLVSSSDVNRWDNSMIGEVAKLWKLDLSSETKLVQLGQSVNDIIHWKNDPFEIIRFLHQCDYHTNEAERMFRSMIQWRLDTDVDTFIPQRYKSDSDNDTVDDEDIQRGIIPEEFHNYCPFFLLEGFDHDGDPILVQRFGVTDGAGLLTKLGKSAVEDALLFFIELLTARNLPSALDWQRNYYEPEVGRRVKQFTNVVDLNGLNWKTHFSRPGLLKVLQDSAYVGQEYYPGLTKRVLIIRAPKIFRVIWKFVKRFYDDRTHRKIILVTEDNYLEALKEYMDIDQLPSVINPTTGNGRPMPGYFADNMNMEGGKVPL